MSTAKNAMLTGQTITHPKWGKCLVLGPVQGSRTKVTIQGTDRGPGWNDFKEKYTGVKFPGGWSRGQNYRYGIKTVVHINELV